MISEERLHKQICDYLKLQYPKVLFNTDMAGVKLSIGQARKVKQLRSNSGFPDIQILEPRMSDFGINFIGEKVKSFLFCGLFLEVKKESPYKKNGMLKKNEHLQKQNELHVRLRKRGYMVQFIWTFEQAKNIIDNYLNANYA